MRLILKDVCSSFDCLADLPTLLFSGGCSFSALWLPKSVQALWSKQLEPIQLGILFDLSACDLLAFRAGPGEVLVI